MTLARRWSMLLNFWWTSHVNLWTIKATADLFSTLVGLMVDLP